MQILSHRGWWTQPAEKNSPAAFLRSFSSGFGTETDLRDALGRLVISHDPPSAEALNADAFFEVHKSLGPALPLALNIKADGLQTLLRKAVDRFALTNYFLFDMSLPDALVSIRQGLTVFTRQSEWEPQPLFYKEAAGVWMDCFHGEWMTTEIIAQHLDAGKRVCVVSPDLHGRDPRAFWDTLAQSGIRQSNDLMLCTDRPQEAKAVLNA